MITRSEKQRLTPSWADELRDAYRQPAALLSDLGLDPAICRHDAAAERLFPFRVTRAFAARMKPGDPDDPLLRQVLPVGAETRVEIGRAHV
mgnify:CR=1 FL=1